MKNKAFSLLKNIYSLNQLGRFNNACISFTTYIGDLFDDVVTVHRRGTRFLAE